MHKENAGLDRHFGGERRIGRKNYAENLPKGFIPVIKICAHSRKIYNLFLTAYRFLIS